MQNYHTPVLLKESVSELVTDKSGIYVDLTFGGGGHSIEILNAINKEGKLIAFDQDPDAEKNTHQIKAHNFHFVASNFSELREALRKIGITKVDGILADLGISSYQINAAHRGFSTRFDADLDMRMNLSSPLSAQTIINTYPEKALHQLLGKYGEVRNAKTLAKAIVDERKKQKINRTGQLVQLLKQYAPKQKENQYYAQVFQALRIETNQELKVLEDMLRQTTEIIKKGGRLVIIAYHSLEDKLVKNLLNKGVLYGEPEKDVYGHYEKPFRPLSKKPIIPTAEEIKANPRARSAKMRTAEKL